MSDPSPPMREIPVAELRPNDWNFNEMSEAQLGTLASQIRLQGFPIHEIVVRRHADGAFEILDGEHQWRASIVAGLVTVPCRILDPEDDRAAISETYRRNALRGSENKLRVARAIRRIQDATGASYRAIARDWSRSEAFIRQSVLYAELADAIAARRAAGIERPAGWTRPVEDVAHLPRLGRNGVAAWLARIQRADLVPDESPAPTPRRPTPPDPAAIEAQFALLAPAEREHLAIALIALVRADREAAPVTSAAAEAPPPRESPTPLAPPDAGARSPPDPETAG